MKKIGVWGYWKENNLGDNWILATMFKIFGQDIVPVPLKITDFSGFDFMICGGGGLFSDRIPPPWSNDTIYTPHGIFCIGTEFGVNKEELQQLVSTSEFFYVRDQMTQDCFDKQFDISVAGDVTFYDPILPQKTLDSNNIALIWRKNFDDLYNWKPIWTYYIGTNTDPKNWEKEISKKGNVTIFDFNTYKAGPVVLMQKYSFIVSQRYHGIVYAIQAGIPVIAIDIAPKIRAIMQEAGLEEYCLKINEFYKFSLVYEKCMAERKDILEKMYRFTQEKKRLVNMAARYTCKVIEELP